MTRSPSLSVALKRLRQQVKTEAAVFLNAARDFSRHVRAAVDSLDDARWAEDRERARVSLAEWSARDRARRLYMAAMSQASQSGRSTSLTKDWWRLRLLAVKSLHDGDQAMLCAGLQPSSHPRRAMAVRRMRERGMVVDGSSE